MPPIEKFDSLEKKLIEALGTLVAKDEHLLTNQATEWNLAQRISVYLETLFPGWDVDTEYGLDGKETKKLPLGRGREEVYSAPKVKTVRPDIIVHERGNAPGKENLLAVEIKRDSASAGEIALDAEKLQGYLSKYHYHFALFLTIPSGKVKDHWRFNVEWRLRAEPQKVIAKVYSF